MYLLLEYMTYGTKTTYRTPKKTTPFQKLAIHRFNLRNNLEFCLSQTMTDNEVYT